MKTKIIIGVVVVIAVVIAIFSTRGSSEQQVSTLTSTDTVKGFYDNWINAIQQKDAEPSRKTLAKSPILSKELRDQLKKAMKKSDTIDPVLCQTVVPENISTRTVFEDENWAQILITSKDKKVTEQAIVTLKRYNNGLYIDNIECSLGEFAPEREFSFEREGFLLKGSIPAPYDSKNWHLVFEENGKPGHVVPLFFDTESQCTDLEKNKSVCGPDQFVEATKVFVRGQMSERGVSIKQLEFVK